MASPNKSPCLFFLALSSWKRATPLRAQFGAAAVNNLVEQVSKRDANLRDMLDVLDALAASRSAQSIVEDTALSDATTTAMDSERFRIAICY